MRAGRVVPGVAAAHGAAAQAQGGKRERPAGVMLQRPSGVKVELPADVMLERQAHARVARLLDVATRMPRRRMQDGARHAREVPVAVAAATPQPTRWRFACR